MPRWTEEARAAQAEIQKSRQSWRKSTGPKTAAGKARVALNATKDGNHSAPILELKKLLRAQNDFLKSLQ